MLKRIRDRCPGGVTVSAGLGNDAACEAELRVTEREPGDVDIGAGAHLLLLPGEVGEFIAREVEDRQVIAFGDAQHASRDGIVLAVNVDADETGTFDHVRIGDDMALGIDDEAGSRAARSDASLSGIDVRTLDLDADHSGFSRVDTRLRTLRRRGRGRSR